MKFSTNFYLLTISSFRIGVPSILFFDKLHTCFIITVYNLENVQNKAQKAWEKFEEKNMEEVSI